jgi:hypothetical protein
MLRGGDTSLPQKYGRGAVPRILNRAWRYTELSDDGDIAATKRACLAQRDVPTRPLAARGITCKCNAQH